jgi:ABC-type antimicrobial peptide transport system permease subunit
MGVVRVLGINKAGVIWLIIVQSMFYVVPAVITGLLLSIPGLYYASNQINSAVGIQIGIYPTTNALILSLGLGILIPIVSSITPITEALKQTLVDALDLTRS